MASTTNEEIKERFHKTLYPSNMCMVLCDYILAKILREIKHCNTYEQQIY